MDSKDYNAATNGLYCKPMTIVYDDSRVINKLEASFTDNARVIINNCHMFIVQATRLSRKKLNKRFLITKITFFEN